MTGNGKVVTSLSADHPRLEVRIGLELAPRHGARDRRPGALSVGEEVHALERIDARLVPHVDVATGGGNRAEEECGADHPA